MPAKQLARQPRLAQQGFHRPVGALMGGAEHEDARTLPCGEISPEFLVCGCQSTDQQTAGTVGQETYGLIGFLQLISQKRGQVIHHVWWRIGWTIGIRPGF